MAAFAITEISKNGNSLDSFDPDRVAVAKGQLILKADLKNSI